MSRKINLTLDQKTILYNVIMSASCTFTEATGIRNAIWDTLSDEDAYSMDAQRFVEETGDTSLRDRQ